MLWAHCCQFRSQSVARKKEVTGSAPECFLLGYSCGFRGGCVKFFLRSSCATRRRYRPTYRTILLKVLCSHLRFAFLVECPICFKATFTLPLETDLRAATHSLEFGIAAGSRWWCSHCSALDHYAQYGNLDVSRSRSSEVPPLQISLFSSSFVLLLKQFNFLSRRDDYVN